jgi:hypothetical protein
MGALLCKGTFLTMPGITKHAYFLFPVLGFWVGSGFAGGPGCWVTVAAGSPRLTLWLWLWQWLRQRLRLR